MTKRHDISSFAIRGAIHTAGVCSALPDQQIVELTDEVLVLRLRTLKTFFLAPGSDLPVRVVVFGVSFFECFHNCIGFNVHIYYRSMTVVGLRMDQYPCTSPSHSVSALKYSVSIRIAWLISGSSPCLSSIISSVWIARSSPARSEACAMRVDKSCAVSMAVIIFIRLIFWIHLYYLHNHVHRLQKLGSLGHSSEVHGQTTAFNDT